MAKKSFILAFFFLFCGVLFFYSFYIGIPPELFPPARKLVGKLEKDTGIRVSLSRVRTNFFSRIDLDNLAFFPAGISSDTPFFKSKTTSIGFSIFSLLGNPKHPVRAVRKLTFIQGKILIPGSRSAVTGGFSAPSASLFSVFNSPDFLLSRIYFKDFALEILSPDSKLPPKTLEGISGFCFFQKKDKVSLREVSFSFFGENQQENWKIKGRIYPQARRGFLLQAEGEKIPLPLLEGFTPSSKVKFFKGKIDFALDLTSEDWQDLARWDYKANIFLEEGGLAIFDQKVVFEDISGEFKLDKEKCLVALRQLRVGNSILKMEGEITAPYTSPSLTAKVESELVNLKRTKLKNLLLKVTLNAQELSIPSLKFDLEDGRVSGNFSLSKPGNLALAQGKGKIEIDNFTPSEKLPKLEKFSLNLTYVDNHLRVSGTDVRKLYQLKLIARRKEEEISIEEFLARIGPSKKDYLSGTFSFQGNLQGSIEEPVVKGKITSDLSLVSLFLGYPEKELTGTLFGTFEFKRTGSPETSGGKGKIRVGSGYWKKLFWKNLGFSFVWRQGGVNINQFTINQKQGSLSLDCTLSPSERGISNFSTRGEAKNFLWGDFVQSGNLEFAGRSREKIVEGKFLLSSWQVNRIHLGQVEGKVEYKPRILTLSSSVADWLEIQGEVNLSSEKETLQGKIEVLPVDWQKLEKIFTSSASPLEGRFSALLNISGELRQPRLQGGFQFQEGKWKGMKFSLEGNCNYDFLSPLALTGSVSFKEPFRGELGGNLRVTNLFSRPEISGEFQSKKIAFSDSLITEKVKLTIRQEGECVKIVSLQAKIKEGEIYLLEGSTLQGNKFTLLAELRNLQLGGLTLFGKVNLSGETKNTTPSSWEADLTTNNLWINQHNLKASKLRIHYQNNLLVFLPSPGEKSQVSGEINFSQYPSVFIEDLVLTDSGKKTLTLKGRVGKEDIRVELRGEQFPLQALLELNNWKFSSKGKVNLNLSVNGPLSAPEIAGEFGLDQGKIYELSFDTFTTSFALEKGILVVKNLKIYAKDKFFLSGKGELPLFPRKGASARKEINLSFQLEEGNLAFLKDLTPNITESQGKINGELTVKGKMDSPEFYGLLTVANAGVQSKSVFKKIEKLDAQLEFVKQSLIVRSCKAKVEPGGIELTGKVEFAFYAKDETFNFRVQDYDFTFNAGADKRINITVEGLKIPQSTIFKRLIYTPSSGEVKTSLRLFKAEGKPTLRGVIELANTHFTYPPKEETTGFWGEIFDYLNLDIELKTESNVWYENELVNANVNGSLKLTGQGDDLKVNGKIESLHGNFSYLNHNFEIKKAVFEVINDVCYLEGTAETKGSVWDSRTNQVVQDTIIMKIDRGKFGENQPKFYAENHPFLSQDEVLKNIFANVNTSSLTTDKQKLLFSREILRWLDNSLTTPLIKNILTYSGLVDSVRVGREISPGETNQQGKEESATTTPDWHDLVKGSKVTLEKYVSERLLLGYSVKLDTLLNRLDLKHEVELAYRLHWKGDVLIRATYELERGRTAPGSLTPERKIYFEPRWRFGWEE